jgi:hypothetical protein
MSLSNSIRVFYGAQPFALSLSLQILRASRLGQVCELRLAGPTNSNRQIASVTRMHARVISAET